MRQRSSHHLCEVAAVAAVVAVGLLAGAQTAAAGPWVPEPGEGYLKLSTSYFESVGTYDRSGEPMDPSYTYRHVGARLYADVGLAPHLGLSASIPYLASRNTPDDSPTKYIKTGFGDLDVAAETGTTVGQVALAGQLQVRIPMYDDVISTDAPTPSAFTERELERRRYIPALGDGSIDVTPQVLFGVSMHPFPGWATASVGPRFRFQGFGDGISYGASLGAYAIPERLAFRVRADGLQRLKGGNRRPTKSYLQVSGGPIVHLIDGFAFEASASYLPVGAFVSKGWSVTGGFSYQGQLFSNFWQPERRTADAEPEPNADEDGDG